MYVSVALSVCVCIVYKNTTKNEEQFSRSFVSGDLKTANQSEAVWKQFERKFSRNFRQTSSSSFGLS